MEEKAHELFWKYVNIHSLMSKNAAKKCAFLELQGRVEELKNIPGAESRISELERIKERIWEI